MSRFYQTLFVMAGANLLVASYVEGWTRFIFAAIWFTFTGIQFGRACQKDDKRRDPSIVVINR